MNFFNCWTVSKIDIPLCRGTTAVPSTNVSTTWSQSNFILKRRQKHRFSSFFQRSFSDLAQVANSSKESNNTPYKRRKQTSLALEALGQLIKDSSIDDVDTDKFNKNDILSLTLSRLLRRKYWPSNVSNSKKFFVSFV